MRLCLWMSRVHFQSQLGRSASVERRVVEVEVVDSGFRCEECCREDRKVRVEGRVVVSACMLLRRVQRALSVVRLRWLVRRRASMERLLSRRAVLSVAAERVLLLSLFCGEAVRRMSTMRRVGRMRVLGVICPSEVVVGRRTAVCLVSRSMESAVMCVEAFR